MANTTAVKLDASNPFIKFLSYAQLGLAANIQDHTPNRMEWAGDKLLWLVEHLPRHIWDALTEPRAVTVILTKVALLVDSFVFYPKQTAEHVRAFIRWIPWPSLATIRFCSYVFTVLLIIGAALRAYGRFSNTDLMNSFKRPVQQQDQQNGQPAVAPNNEKQEG